MTDPFTIRYEPGRNLVYFDCWGKWTVDDLRNFIHTYRLVLGSTQPGFVSIVDNRRFEIQEQAIQDGMSEVIEMGLGRQPGPSFIIVDRAFQEMHVKRMSVGHGLQRKDLRFVSSTQEAERLVDELIASKRDSSAVGAT